MDVDASCVDVSPVGNSTLKNQTTTEPVPSRQENPLVLNQGGFYTHVL
jgi:hypothetical protein